MEPAWITTNTRSTSLSGMYSIYIPIFELSLFVYMYSVIIRKCKSNDFSPS